MKFLNLKFLIMNKVAKYRKILRCTNKDQLWKFWHVFRKIKYKWFYRTKV